MDKMLVFISRPGAGKSYLIRRFLDKWSDFKLVNVFQYIKAVKDKYGRMPEVLNIEAYRKVYQDVVLKKGNIILELGTNYPEFNIEQLAGLSSTFQNTLRSWRRDEWIYNPSRRVQYPAVKVLDLSKRYNITLIICLQDIEVCRKRCLNRIVQNKENKYSSLKTLEIRLKRPFPQKHKKLAMKFGIPYIELDMRLPVEERLGIIEKRINI